MNKPLTKYYFSITRLLAVVYKEFIQMQRDRLTFAMMIGIPVMQLLLFGFAINANPKHLPTALLAADSSAFTRAFVTSLENTDYFRIVEYPQSEVQAQQMLARGEVLFVVQIPVDFTRKLVRGLRPQILIEADATEPIAIANAVAVIPVVAGSAFAPYFKGGLAELNTTPTAVNVITHLKYNPENITKYNIVPGLIGVVLTMTMIVITSLAITRERERGTMESLLATPALPIEVMFGKIIPYIIVGYIQIILILLAAFYVFAVPIQGSVILLLICSLPFIAANLGVGLTFSSIARNQLQSVQMSFFFFLPSILLSGFMFPFSGMPQWAQWLGSALPLTYYLRVVRGILLKGNTIWEILPNVWPIIIFFVVIMFIGIKRYRKTLD